MKPVGFDERWLQPGGVVPVDVQTTWELVREIQRLRRLLPEEAGRPVKMGPNNTLILPDGEAYHLVYSAGWHLCPVNERAPQEQEGK